MQNSFPIITKTQGEIAIQIEDVYSHLQHLLLAYEKEQAQDSSVVHSLAICIQSWKHSGLAEHIRQVKERYERMVMEKGEV